MACAQVAYIGLVFYATFAFPSYMNSPLSWLLDRGCNRVYVFETRGTSAMMEHTPMYVH